MSARRPLWWFARFEMRLAWRDVLSMMTAGRQNRERKIALVLIVVALVLHGIASVVLPDVKETIRTDKATLIIVLAGVLLSGAAMLSQAMESVTRTFYTRSDLELILSAPVQAGRVFAVRIAAMALSAMLLSALLIGPFIDVLAWRNGVQWLGAYGVLIAVSLTTTALGVALTSALFLAIGPKRTRLVAQIIAAIVGGVFVIGLQVAGMFSTGTLSRLAFLRSKFMLAHMPDIDGVLWWPARAALGDWRSLLFVFGGSLVLFLLVTAHYAPRFATFVLAASSTPHSADRKPRGSRAFHVTPAPAALRLKERRLLLRDPWLISQSLMQLLYLLPPALLLWRSFGTGQTAAIVLIPVLIMAAGQLAGGLAWLTISGEDAPDFVISAPVTASALLRGKIEAVMQCIGLVFFPFAALLALISPGAALVAAAGITAAAVSSTAIQLWFRSQSKRNQFRRRHTSSRIATLAEAFVSITWAAAGAVAVAGSWLALIVAILASAILLGVYALSPANKQRRPHTAAIA